MSLKSWFKQTVDKVFKKEETVKSEESSDKKEESSLTVKNDLKEDQTNIIQNERTNTMGKTSENIKERLISILIPVVIKLIERELPKLLDKYLSPEKLTALIEKGLAALKKKIKETPTEWDDVLTKPFIDLMEEMIGVSADSNLQEAADDIQKEITDKVVEKIVDSIEV